MPLLVRNPRKHDLFNLYAAIGGELNMSLTDSVFATKFKSIVEEELKNQERDDRLRFGKRTEEMFGYIADALGNCEMVIKEDAGGGFVRDKNILIPDYRLYTGDKKQYLVEVKNRHGDKLVVRENYVSKLRKYADIARAELKFAIYWSEDNIWTLVSPDVFTYKSGQWEMGRVDAGISNEMSNCLGDFAIATDEPLVIKTFGDPTKPLIYNEKKHTVSLTTLRYEFYSRYVLIADDLPLSFSSTRS